MNGPLDQPLERLPAAVRRVVLRATPIPSIAQRAQEMRATHPGLVRADIGQIAGLRADHEVLYGPQSGLEALRAALAETMNLSFGLADTPAGALGPRNVSICTGAAEGLALLLRGFADGAGVGVPRGYWENYANGIDLAGGRMVLVDWFDGTGALDLAAVRRAIAAEDLRVLITNFPSNPTGAVLDDAEYEALGALIRETGVIVIADEVYARLRFDGAPPRTLLAYAPAHVVAVSSASKEYLMPGARVGFVVCAREAVTDLIIGKLVRGTTGSPNVPGQQRLLTLVEAGLRDLRAGREPALLVELRTAMRRRRDLLTGVLEAHGMPCVGRGGRRPEGTIFLTAALPAWWSGDAASFAEAALERGLFSCVPGAAFGLDRAVRFSYGALKDEDLDRLDAALATLRREA